MGVQASPAQGASPRRLPVPSTDGHGRKPPRPPQHDPPGGPSRSCCSDRAAGSEFVLTFGSGTDLISSLVDGLPLCPLKVDGAGVGEPVAGGEGGAW